MQPAYFSGGVLPSFQVFTPFRLRPLINKLNQIKSLWSFETRESRRVKSFIKLGNVSKLALLPFQSSLGLSKTRLLLVCIHSEATLTFQEIFFLFTSMNLKRKVVFSIAVTSSLLPPSLSHTHARTHTHTHTPCSQTQHVRNSSLTNMSLVLHAIYGICTHACMCIGVQRHRLLLNDSKYLGFTRYTGYSYPTKLRR